MVYNSKSEALIRACKDNNLKDVQSLFYEDKRAREAGFISNWYSGGLDKALGELLIPLDVNYMSQYEGIPPLIAALMSGSDDLKVFELLLSRPETKVNIVPFSYTFPKETKLYSSPALVTAIYADNERAVALLLKRADLDVNQVYDWSKYTPLMTAVNAGHKPIVELLLNDPRTLRAKVNHFGKTALDIAKEKGRDDLVDLFDCDINTMELKDIAKPPKLSLKTPT